MEFENDIFVSYAHIDDQSLIEGTKGWITNLHRALSIRLSQLLGKEPKIWRDPKLQGNDAFADRLVERLPKVAVLVSVMTPRYVRSEWCLRELNEFWKAAEKTGGARIADKIRVFKVIKTPVPLEEHPSQLQEVLGYEFFQVDSDTGRAHEFAQSSDPEGQKRYWAKLDDLAHDIADLLRSVDELDLTPGATGTTAQAALSVADLTAQAAPAAPAVKSDKKIVYLADTSFDLRDKRDIIKRELLGHGHVVLPDRPLPLVDSECREFVRDLLSTSDLSVHLIGENYGVVPEGGRESFVVLQSELAVERSLQVPGFNRLIWKPPSLESEDERQQRFIEHLETDSRMQTGADLLESSLEDFKVAVNLRLRPQEKKRVEQEVGVEDGDQLTRIYLICDQRDGDATMALEDHLYDKGFEVIIPVFEGDESQVRKDHEENLSICDAVLLYYGAGNELWMRRKLREVQKSAAFGRVKPMVGRAIYTAPPATPQKQRVRTREAMVIHQTGDFDPAVLEPFIEVLEGKS